MTSVTDAHPRNALPAPRPPAAIRVAMVTNIPAPYRVPVLNLLARDTAFDLRVFYSARREPDRDWDLPALQHDHHFLRESIFPRRNGGYTHNNTDVFGELRAFDPHVVINTGFNPTHLYAFAFAQLFRRRHIAMTDSTLDSEAELSKLHRAVRRIVIRRSAAFVAASQSGRSLLVSYGASAERVHLSPLCANMSIAWHGASPNMPMVDFLFSGRLVNIKNPMFAIEVALGVAQRIGRRTSLAILGAGPLEPQVRQRAAELAEHIEVHVVGNVRQAEVPAWFASARVFLFPTSWDPWGVVANEACLAGVPTIVSPRAGAAGELIIDEVNGYIRPLQVSDWVDAATRLIGDDARRALFSQCARERVAPYNAQSAAAGIAEAIRMAAAHGDPQTITGT